MQVMKEVLEDSLFYGSDGGMTVSGGEPTMQPAFTLALLKAARAANITTAIETCGYGSWASFEALAPYCNTFLYDVKLVNPEKHLHYTKKENTRILSNLRGIAEHFPNCDIWIRTPIIPGANDSTDDILALRDLASSISFLFPGTPSSLSQPWRRKACAARRSKCIFCCRALRRAYGATP